MQDSSEDLCEDAEGNAAGKNAETQDVDPCAQMGLRERKRRLTRLRIEDEATRLFLERSYTSVTLEDICSAADISRRTFFNYFDSKDHVALGVAPPPLTQDDLDKLENTPPAEDGSGQPLESRLFGLFLTRRAEQFRDCDGTVLDAQLAEEVARRRGLILERNSELALAKLSRFQDLRQRLGVAITKHLQKFPEQRRFSEDFTAAEEAFLIVASAISTLWASSTLNAQEKTPVVNPQRAYATSRALSSLHHNIAENVKPDDDRGGATAGRRQ